jgi:S-formylglutathione hydrolase FrmB
MALIETHIFSKVLGMQMDVNIILPQERRPYESDGKIKVLWLLHGGSGDYTAWLRMSSIERYALEYGIAVIMPGVFNSCYTNMAHGGKFFTYMTEELPKKLYSMFPRLSKNREDNYISGFSNGGYGCFKIGLSRPDLYGAIGAFSAGDKADVEFINDGSSKARGRITIFGDRDIRNTNNDLKHLGREALKKDIPVPKVYHACGSLDPWLDLNHLMKDFFQNLHGNPYEYIYHEADGLGHVWDFWDSEIQLFFKYLELKKENKYIVGL